MKLIFFFLLLTFYTSLAFGQNSSFITSEGKNAPLEGDYFSIENNIFHIQGRTVHTYEKKTLKVLKSTSIKNYPEKQRNIINVKFENEYYMVFCSKDDLKPKPESIKFYVRNIDFETGSLGDEEFIFESKNVRSLGSENGTQYVSFSPQIKMNLSKDESKLMFSCGSQLRVYEEGMKLMWETDNIYGDHTPKNLYDIQYELIDNDGTFYTAIKSFKEGGDPKTYSSDACRELISSRNRKPNYSVVILKINSTEVVEISSNALNGLLLHSLTLHKDSKDKLLCLGLYFNTDNLVYSKGFFSLGLEDENSEINYYPIPLEIENQGEKKRGKEQNGIKDLHQLEIKNTADGNLLIITEQDGDFNPARHERYGIGNYKNIIITKMSIKDGLVWIKKLTKYQIQNGSTTTGLSYGCGSYKYLNLKGKHYLIYLDDKQNQKLNLESFGKYCKSCRNGYLFAYIFDDDGNLTKEPIFNLDKESSNSQYDYKYYLKSISDTEFIFPIFKNKKSTALVKVIVK
jgi:hypothetical protein